MSAPAYPKTRLYYDPASRSWLMRVDTSTPGTREEAETHCAAEYGLSRVVCVETDALTQAELAALKAAKRWTGAPPDRPRAASSGKERLAPR